MNLRNYLSYAIEYLRHRRDIKPSQTAYIDAIDRLNTPTLGNKTERSDRTQGKDVEQPHELKTMNGYPT
ncbi:hypothetical protein K469DRAFT_72977 [Zopfia rhizophila CBS 207.26]|uniref:Uncharacterized protein n=1 Tax=Zopfia rhizophila CBS 207.26 TaxID=1314779 RepID=A0A6A6EDQ6_9PEZI|nr:hypothetical protein K469DRAFT_72977 [Zopfia rhizophila CBS 207.26]